MDQEASAEIRLRGMNFPCIILYLFPSFTPPKGDSLRIGSNAGCEHEPTENCFGSPVQTVWAICCSVCTRDSLVKACLRIIVLLELHAGNCLMWVVPRKDFVSLKCLPLQVTVNQNPPEPEVQQHSHFTSQGCNPVQKEP